MNDAAPMGLPSPYERRRGLKGAILTRNRSLTENLLAVGRHLAAARRWMKAAEYRAFCAEVGYTPREAARLADLAVRLAKTDCRHDHLHPLALLTLGGPSIPADVIHRLSGQPLGIVTRREVLAAAKLDRAVAKGR